jgi:hypothetical protein
MSILVHSSLQLPYQSITKPTTYLNGPTLLSIKIIRPWAHQTDIAMCRLFWLNFWLISSRFVANHTCIFHLHQKGILSMTFLPHYLKGRV